ncbi:Elongation factor 1-gamma, partial [Dufourea novaeangliae]
TLYTYPENFRAYKVLIAAQFSGAQVKIADDFVFGETNKSEAFLKKFPLGKVPAFETNDGKCITESNAIAYYVANDQLRGKTELERAEIVQWFGFADSEILPASCGWVFPLLGIMPYNKQTVEHAKDDVKKTLTALNSHLLTRTYLVGERLTLADISVAMTLLHLYQYILEPNLRKPYQNVNRWFQTVIYQPESMAVIGAFKLAEKTLEYDPKKFAETQGKSSKKEKKEKESKKEPKESKKEAAEELDPAEAALAAEVFMSCNLIGGMYQRLDKMRKGAFASACLFGTDNDSTISGIWVWRGQELAFTLCPDWQVDYESYSWTKLDPSKPETAQLVEQYFSWTGADKEGRAFNQGKIFK